LRRTVNQGGGAGKDADTITFLVFGGVEKTRRNVGDVVEFINKEILFHFGVNKLNRFNIFRDS